MGPGTITGAAYCMLDQKQVILHPQQSIMVIGFDIITP